MIFDLVVGSIVALGGLACIIFAGPLAAKMRSAEERQDGARGGRRTRLQQPWQMRVFGCVMLAIGAVFVLSALA